IDAERLRQELGHNLQVLLDCQLNQELLVDPW
ncbi:MAG: hypothetical protein RLZZ486_799, partial [Actinomycetota bacterium]